VGGIPEKAELAKPGVFILPVENLADRPAALHLLADAATGDFNRSIQWVARLPPNRL
jgi:hypothetical protein